MSEYDSPLENVMRIECSQERYFEIDAYSSTDLRAVLKEAMNPWGVKKQRDTPFRDTDQTLMGSLTDCYLTEPEMVDRRYIRIPEFSFVPTTDAQRGVADAMIAGAGALEAYKANYAQPTQAKADKMAASLHEWVQFHKGLIMDERKPIRGDLWTRAEAAVEALHKDLRLPRKVEGFHSQVCFVGEAYGVKWKGMLDFLGPHAVIDLKTTEDWLKIRSNFFRRGYNVQGRLYTWLADTGFMNHVYAETIGPYRTKIVDTTEHIEEASGLTKNLMQRIAHADKTGDWKRTMEYYENNGFEEL